MSRKQFHKKKRMMHCTTEYAGTCDTCGTQLGIKGGMGGTGLCGPCCTGESETLEEFGDTW